MVTVSGVFAQAAGCSQTTSSEQVRKEREVTHLCAGDGDAADVRVGFCREDAPAAGNTTLLCCFIS